jgi:hypothetical protein
VNWLFDLLKRELTCVIICNCLLFLVCRAKAQFWRIDRLGGGFCFLIYSDVKNLMRVRLGCEERLDLCERSRAVDFYFLCWVMAVFQPENISLLFLMI